MKTISLHLLICLGLSRLEAQEIEILVDTVLKSDLHYEHVDFNDSIFKQDTISCDVLSMKNGRLKFFLEGYYFQIYSLPEPVGCLVPDFSKRDNNYFYLHLDTFQNLKLNYDSFDIELKKFNQDKTAVVYVNQVEYELNFLANGDLYDVAIYSEDFNKAQFLVYDFKLKSYIRYENEIKD